MQGLLDRGNLKAFRVSAGDVLRPDKCFNGGPDEYDKRGKVITRCHVDLRDLRTWVRMKLSEVEKMVAQQKIGVD